MPSKLRLYLVRHGESQANLDVNVNALHADHVIPLSERGCAQAIVAGRVIGEELRSLGAKNARLWRSPYLRTRQTADGIIDGLNDVLDGDLHRPKLDVRESDLIREQEFGLFDGIPDEELPIAFPREHALYSKYEMAKGRYFARMPMGESRCDVAARCKIFFGSLDRDREQHGIENVIIVSHGVTLRCFIKEWLHLPYEWIENERNPGNCSVRLIENGRDRGYLHAGEKPTNGHDAQETRENGIILPR